MIKKLDRLLLSSFIPPFIVTFMIAIFVLVMQTLWLYIDDIAGKGLGMFLILELLAYKCVSLIPLALPLAMLISSVMVLGSLAEHYELSSFKSAGVPLLRIMRPLMFYAAVAVLFSYYCSNSLIPLANLKFGSRMYDIQRQKPTLRLEEGIFNDDFQGYAIHIGDKDVDNRTIRDVLIYDHEEAARGRMTQIVAEEGEMYMTEDGRFFVMKLRNGHQYIETRPSRGSDDAEYPFVRTSFSEWTKVFDLQEFELQRTNEELFRSNRHMMSIGQLKVAIDSIAMRIFLRQKNFANSVSTYFYFIPIDSTVLKMQYEQDEEEAAEARRAAEEMGVDTLMTDSLEADTFEPDSLEADAGAGPADSARLNTGPAVKPTLKKVLANAEPNEAFRKAQEAARKRRTRSRGKPLEQREGQDLSGLDRFLYTFPVSQQSRLLSKAKTFVRSIESQSESAYRSLDRMRENHVKHIYEMHTKYSMAVVCFIFLFIGAPMGAIVRKGGFGYPILVSIIFFMLFIILTIFCRKIAETFVVPAAMAAWLPCLVLFPIGVILTRKAMNDSKLVDSDRYLAFFSKLFKKKEDAAAPANA